MEIFGKKIDGAFIIIAVLIIAGVTWGLVSMVMGMMSRGTSMIAAQTGALESYQFAAYDNKYVSGDTAIAAIRMAQTPAPNKLKITVKIIPEKELTFGYADATASYKPYKDDVDGEQISAVATFKASLTMTNGVVTQITFVQQP